MTDAVVIGSGPNGLVAANVLADAGWQVVVLEAADHPGGAVVSRDDLLPGAVTDVCSAFYPLAVASPAFRPLALEDHGVTWRRAPAVLAHPAADGRCAVLGADLDATARSLDALAPGDGDVWRRLYRGWERIGGPFLDALLSPIPPIAAGARLARALGVGGMARLARFGVLPVRRWVEEEFGGMGGLLLAGCAAHADLAPEAVGSSVFGYVLAMVGQEHGWPVPEGGAGRLTAALVRRLERHGGTVATGRRVTSVVVRGGRAVGVTTAGGEEVPARRAVVADVAAPALYGGLVPWEHLPLRLRADMERFHWDWATFKVDWLVDGGIPWTAAEAGAAGTVHVGTLDEMTLGAAQLATGHVPAAPILVLGQMSVADPTRAPAGTESVWAYTHVPRRVRGDAGDGDVALTGSWDPAEAEQMADRIEGRVEQLAPGFRARIAARSLLPPPALERHDANLDGSAINGGTAALHQQFVFRPAPGLGRAETPVPGLYLASSSAHPGGGVHGACGANAARAALAGPLGRRTAAALSTWIRRSRDTTA